MSAALDKNRGDSVDRNLPDDTPENREKALGFLRRISCGEMLSALEVINNAESYREMIEELRALVGYAID